MANVLIQSQNSFNLNPKMDSMTNSVAVEADKNGVKADPNEDTLSNLMEKLHAKATQSKSWADLNKVMKQSVNEKRHILDGNERNQLQKCLDTIQKNIRVTSLQSMVERLETICRQLGLKFSVPPQTSPKRVECFVHSEMYYVEVLLETPSGHVLDCKVAHQAEALSCPELTDVLQKGDFIEFTKHLEGLSAIYQINADKKNKSKAYLALHALEIDLTSLSDLQNNTINDINNLVHKSPVGILEPRKGGHPMKLTYFVPPYDLIDLKNKTCLPLNVDVILEKSLGYSATICIESSSSHRLQHESLINLQKTPEGKNLPQFSALTALNSTQLPACFVLRLEKPLVTSLDILKKIRADTNIEFNHDLVSKSEPIIQLIAKQLMKDETTSNGPFHVNLPKQSHCYHLNESCEKLDGVVITSIPITHPTHVPRILVHLRQQVLFNVIIGSFIRQTPKPETSSNIFEVTTTSMSNITIQFEHPTEESLATLDLDLRDVTNVKCKLYPTSSLASYCSDDFASKVMQRCLSIPVTMRSIINKCKERAAALKEQMAREQSSQMTLNQNELYFASLNGSNGSLDPNLGGRQQSFQYNLQQQLQQFNGNQSQQMNQQMSGQNPSLQGQQNNLRFLAQKLNFHNLNHDMLQKNRFQMNPQLHPQQQQELLQQSQQLLNQSPNSQKQNTMLMSMLRDLPAANQTQAINFLKQQQQQQQLQQQLQFQQLQFLQQQQQQQQQSQQKPKKQRKRKITSDNLTRSPGSSTGKSPKRKLSDDDLPDDGMASDAYQWGNDANACRPSSTPSSTASFSETIGNIKQELNMSGGMTPTSGGDTLNAYYLNQRMPFDGSQTDFNEFNANDLSLYGESGGTDVMMSDIKPPIHLDISQPLISAKCANKRTTKRMRSDTSDDASGTGDEGHNEQLKIIKSLEDLHQKDTFSKFFPNKDVCGENAIKKTGLNNIKIPKASNKSDVRRCSSAGIEVGGDIKKGLLKGFEGIEEMTELSASLKKERKRKRAESVDSLKGPALCASSTTGRNPSVNPSSIASIVCSESAMMPPPLPGSLSDVTSSSSLPALDPNVKITPKMSPTSSTLGPSTSPNMKISSSGKKALGSNVSSTSSGEAKASKLLANKLDKSPSLSSMLKSPKQGYTVSPKAVDSEAGPGGPGVAVPQPGKGLGFKTSKTKPSKSGLLSSPGRIKEHNKSQLVSGMKQKSGGISSTSSLSATKGGISAVSSSSSLSGVPTGNSMSSSSVSSSKQQSAKLAKISRKSSLTAVVDRLHQKQDATGLPTPQPGGPTESGKPESSSLSSNRPDTTSSPKVSQSGSNKMAEKAKYSRSSDQFTIKQNNSVGSLKISLTKTKLSNETTNKIGPGGTGLFKSTSTSKFTIPKLPKTSSTPSIASTTTTSTTPTPVVVSPSLKRPPTVKAGIVTAGNVRPNVSSSTHPAGPTVSPKATSGTGFNGPHNKPVFGDRHGVKPMGANQMAHKNPAINRMADKFKSNTEPTSTTKTGLNVDISSTPSNSYQPNAKPMGESVRPPVYSKFGSDATVPIPVGFSRSISTSGNVSPQLPASTTPGFQPNKPLFSRSISANETENIDRLLPNWASIDGAANDLAKEPMTMSKSKASDTIASPSTPLEKAGVSSSSDVKASTSTPSSPAEMALISDALQNPPPLIPTEAIDDSSEGGSGGSASVEPTVECENSTQNNIDSTQLVRESHSSTPFSANVSTPQVSANETSNEVSTSDARKGQPFESGATSTSSTQSKPETQVVSESKVRFEDDEDNDGLVIDDQSVPSTPSRLPTISTAEAVSSSTSRLTAANESQSPSKPSTSPTSSSTPAMALSGTPFPAVTSPSNQSTASSMQRASPYPINDIDDDLMDEALVGSNE